MPVAEAGTFSKGGVHMRWLKFNWHSFWFNYHNQLRSDALDTDERSLQQMKMKYHHMKLTKLLCD